jgi:hypothetical protein
VDEPFAIDRPRYLLQNLDAPDVVLDQAVVGGEDGSDFALSRERRDLDLNGVNAIWCGMPYRCTSRTCPDLLSYLSSVE